jgi:3,4-dihydroxy 2-butanone 4-phosphate synthase / GTP cyclohydrolase II
MLLESSKIDARIPIAGRDFRMRVYVDPKTGAEHIAFLLGDVVGQEAVAVRVHSECITGDVFGSQRCDCGYQLQEALNYIAERNTGILIYLRQEGRGIGLVNKLRAYKLQDEQGLDTIEANLKLGHQADERDFGLAAIILKDLGPASVAMLTNNPLKLDGLEAAGVKIIDRIKHPLHYTKENRRYLDTKRAKMGHL